MCIGRERYRGKGKQLITYDRGRKVGEIDAKINKKWRSSPYRNGRLSIII
jgi:hypothetical protein